MAVCGLGFVGLYRYSSNKRACKRLYKGQEEVVGCGSLAKKITYPITLEITINESELAVLKYLDKRLAGEKSVSIAIKEICSKLNASDSSVRRCFRSLARKGLITVVEGRRKDGSCAANSYAVTCVGSMVLRQEKEEKVSKKQKAQKPAEPRSSRNKIPAPVHI